MPKTRWIAAALTLGLLATAAPAQAVVERDCIVSINTRSGWSIENKRRVHFMTGLELSRITTVLKIEFHAVYVVIWHGSGLPTVARLDALLLGVGREFTAEDFLRLYEYEGERLATQLEGEGKDLKWRLRARTPGGWVDAGMPAWSGLMK